MPIFTDMPECYAKYRPAYPQLLVDELRKRTIGSRGEKLVDWGAGSGELTLRLSPFFDHVTAIDFASNMVRVGEEKSRRKEAFNIEWLVARAEDVEFAPQSCDLITAAASFHWMDQSLLVSRASESLKTGGALAVIGGAGGDLKRSGSPMHKVALECAERHCRKLPSGIQPNAKRRQNLTNTLETAGFRIEHFPFPTQRTMDLRGFVGHLHAYFNIAPGPLIEDDRREAFERELLRSLSDANPSGLFHETLNYNLTIAYGDRFSGTGSQRTP